MNILVNQFSLPTAVADDGVLKELRALIEAGGYEAGDRLPPERDLISKLGVTRGALRKALDTLEREGTIWRHVGKGTFVAGDNAPGFDGSLADLGRQLTPFRMVRARLCIEPALAREAAINASTEAMAQLRVALERARSAKTWPDYEAEDDRFHQAIAAASDNPLLLYLFNQLNQVKRAVAWGAVVRDTPTPPEGHRSFREHETIVDAIEQRDAEAAHQAMRAHLHSVSGRLFERS